MVMRAGRLSLISLAVPETESESSQHRVEEVEDCKIRKMNEGKDEG